MLQSFLSIRINNGILTKKKMAAKLNKICEFYLFASMLNLVLESDARADSKLPFQLKVSSSRAGSDTPTININ